MKPRQARVLQQLEDAFDQMRAYDGRPAVELEDSPEFATDLMTFDRALGAAIRAGLQDHDLVKPWLAANKDLGQRDFLRRIQKGLEAGVRRPLKLSDMWLSGEADRLIEEAKHGAEFRGRPYKHRPQHIRMQLVKSLEAGSADRWLGRDGAKALVRALKAKAKKRESWRKQLDKLMGNEQPPTK